MNPIVHKHNEYFKTYNPYYSHVLSSFSISITKELPTLAVYFDKQKQKIGLLINPSYFHSKTFKEQIATLIHEMSHVTNYHLVRLENFECKNNFNIAADMAINQYIKNLPKGVLYPSKKMRKNMTTDYYYGFLNDADKEEEKNESKFKKGMKSFFGFRKKQQNSNSFSKNKSVGNHSKWGDGNPKDVTEATTKILKDAIENNKISNDDLDSIKSDLKNMSKKVRSLPNSFSKGKNIFDNALSDLRASEKIMSSEIDWKAEIQKFVKKNIKKKIRNTIKKPNKRYGIPYSRHRLFSDEPKGVIVVDISPSIPKELLKVFVEQVKDMLKYVKECTIYYVDYDIRKKIVVKKSSDKHFDEDIDFGFGTDLCTIFKHLKKQKKSDYNFLVYFTDLEADIPTVDIAPPCSVLWAVYNPTQEITNDDVRFGEVLCINQ